MNKNKNFCIVASIVFPFEGSEVYRETFTMSGTDVESVTKRVRLMLDDPRYMVSVRSI